MIGDSLELQFCTEENLPRIAQKVGGVGAERRAGHCRHWILEIVVVPKIDEITPDLQAGALFYGNRFHQTEVPLLVGRSSERIFSKVATTRHAVFEKCARCGSWCNDEAGG